MIDKELKKILEKLMAAELGPKKGRYELFIEEQENKSSLKITAIDKQEGGIPNKVKYQSNFASMFARKSLVEIIDPEMVPSNVSSLKVLISPIEHYSYLFGLNYLGSNFTFGRTEFILINYNLLVKKAKDYGGDINAQILTEKNKLIMTIENNCIKVYVPMLFDNFLEKTIEASIHETIHVMTMSTVLSKIIENSKVPITKFGLIAKSIMPFEVVAHALTPYIIRDYMKDNDYVEKYKESIKGLVANNNCDYPTVHGILSNNDTLEGAFNECMERVRV